jgi:hypothetical protein
MSQHPATIVEPVIGILKIAPLKKIQKKIVEPIATPLELQLTQQLMEQTCQLEEMKQMMKPLLEIAEKAKKEREAEEECKATAMRKAKKEREAEAVPKAEAARKAEELRRARRHALDVGFLLDHGIQVVTPYAEMDKSFRLLIDQYILERTEYEKTNRRRIRTQETIKFNKVRTPASISYDELLLNEVMSKFREKESKIREIESQIREIERQNSEKRHEIVQRERALAEASKAREIAENAPRQEEARKRSAARIQAGEFSIWMKYDNEYRMGTPQELFTKGHHVWTSDRTPITVDGKVCVGPRLGSYMGIAHNTAYSYAIARGLVNRDGKTYDGTYEPQLY